MVALTSLSSGMKVWVRRKPLYRGATGDWFPAIIERTEIEDGEEYIIGSWIETGGDSNHHSASIEMMLSLFDKWEAASVGGLVITAVHQRRPAMATATSCHSADEYDLV